MFYKPEIRKIIQQRRRQLDAAFSVQAAQAVAARAIQISQFLEAKRIAAYIAINGELDPSPLLQCAENLQKQIYLPAIIPDQLPHEGGLRALDFYAYKIGDPLIKIKYGIPQPDSKAVAQKMTPQQLDVIFLPLIAFDPQGNRLGHGAGHYDVTLSFIKQQQKPSKPCLIGLAYEFQKLDAITPDQWDVPLDIIITEENIYITTPHYAG